MPRSARQKSSSKHGSSRDTKDYSDSDKESELKDKKGNGYKEDASASGSSSRWASKDLGGSIEKRKSMDSKESKEYLSKNGEYKEGNSLKKRKEKAEDGGDGRWNGGDVAEVNDVKRSSKDKERGESKSRKREDSVSRYNDELGKKGSNGKSEWKHKDSSARREVAEKEKSRDRDKDRDSHREKDRKSKDARTDKFIDEDSRLDSNSADLLLTPEPENQHDRKMRKRRDGLDTDALVDEAIDRDDKYANYREGKRKGDHSSKERSLSRSEEKYYRDSKDGSGSRQRRPKTHESERDDSDNDYPHSRDRRRRSYDNDRDFEWENERDRSRGKDHYKAKKCADELDGSKTETGTQNINDHDKKFGESLIDDTGYGKKSCTQIQLENNSRGSPDSRNSKQEVEERTKADDIEGIADRSPSSLSMDRRRGSRSGRRIATSACSSDERHVEESNQSHSNMVPPRGVSSPSMMGSDRRLNGNTWRASWPSPMPNGYMHFPPMMPQFPPMYGVRPSLEMPYHIPDASHFRPMGWPNVMDGSAQHAWDANGMYRDEMHHFEWDQNRNGRAWDPNLGIWQGQNGDIHMETSPVSVKDDFPLRKANEQNQTHEHADVDAPVTESIDACPEPPVHETASDQPRALPEIEQLPFCFSYLTKLDISAELTCPKLYDKVLKILSLESNPIDDEHDKFLVSLKDGSTSVRKNVASILNATVFPASNDAVFERAMGAYEKLRGDEIKEDVIVGWCDFAKRSEIETKESEGNECLTMNSFDDGNLEVENTHVGDGKLSESESVILSRIHHSSES